MSPSVRSHLSVVIVIDAALFDPQEDVVTLRCCSMLALVETPIYLWQKKHKGAECDITEQTLVHVPDKPVGPQPQSITWIFHEVD